MQEKLFYSGSVLHMCLNADCFYCETVLDIDDIVWRETWDRNIEDLAMIPHCPSCNEVLWREMNGTTV